LLTSLCIPSGWCRVYDPKESRQNKTVISGGGGLVSIPSSWNKLRPPLNYNKVLFTDILVSGGKREALDVTQFKAAINPVPAI